MNLTQLIEQWIGEVYTFKKVHWGDQIYTNEVREDDTISLAEGEGYNRAKQELKSKIPDLIEQIKKEIDENAREEAEYADLGK